jgi:hypothetical protein
LVFLVWTAPSGVTSLVQTIRYGEWRDHPEIAKYFSYSGNSMGLEVTSQELGTKTS